MSDILTGAIEMLLKREPSCYQPVEVIALDLNREGFSCTYEEVEQAIDSSANRFEMAHGEPPMWRVRSSSMTGSTNVPSLYHWQKSALAAWEKMGERGIIEAVTGTGKTFVGVEAIRRTLEKGGKAHVLVPTIELQNQWASVIKKSLPRVRLGRRGNQACAEFKRKDVIISVINSARDFTPLNLPRGSLLIADEVHRYGACKNAKALHKNFDKRLGLTATLEREDKGVFTFLQPYFGKIVYRIGYREAINQDVVANFCIAFIGVDFSTQDEQESYEECAERCRMLRRWFINSGWAPSEPFGEFMRRINQIRDGKADDNGRRPTYEAICKAGLYLKTFSKKRQILATTQTKLDALEKLVPVIRRAAGSIVFSETIESAENAAARIDDAGAIAEVTHSKHSMDERKDILDDFKQGSIEAICAPRILDEGVDVPDADFGIILAASKQRRQMIQRMGRVLRKKPDGRHARFAIIYVRGTSEDPERGAHETFLEEITEVASGQKIFSPHDPVEAVTDFLTI